MAISSARRVALFSWLLLLPTPAFGQIHCDVLWTSATRLAGRCVADSRTVVALVLESPRPGDSGQWLGTQARIFGERGDSTTDIVDWTAFGPALVSLRAGDSLFSYCWCQITRASVDTEGLHFDADPDRVAPPTTADLTVLTRVRTYFSDSARWNRTSDRARGVTYCPRDAPSRTLYCALQEANLAVRGEFYLYTPATVAIRDAIAAASPRRYQHPLDGFNNDPLLDFATFRRSLEDAEQRMRAAMGRPRGGA